MGLNLIGERVAAEHAIAFLRNSQAPDGSWFGQLGSAVPIDEELHQFTMQGVEDGHKIRDTNFIAYIATAIWHHYCLHGDTDYATANWPMVKAAVDFVVALQSPEGDIRWTAPDPQTPEDDALVTGNSSIHKSLICAEKLANALGHDAENWRRRGWRWPMRWPTSRSVLTAHGNRRRAIRWIGIIRFCRGRCRPSKARRASPRAGMIS